MAQWYVSSVYGTDGNAGTSWATAVATIQYVRTSLGWAANDEIIIASGEDHTRYSNPFNQEVVVRAVDYGDIASEVTTYVPSYKARIFENSTVDLLADNQATSDKKSEGDSVSSWAAISSTIDSTTVADDGIDPFSGIYKMAVIPTGTSVIVSQSITTVIGVSYTFSAGLRDERTSSGVCWLYAGRSIGSADYGTSTAVSTDSTWEEKKVIFTATSTTTWVGFLKTSVASTFPVYFDEAYVAAGTAPTTYLIRGGDVLMRFWYIEFDGGGTVQNGYEPYPSLTTPDYFYNCSFHNFTFAGIRYSKTAPAGFVTRNCSFYDSSRGIWASQSVVDDQGSTYYNCGIGAHILNGSSGFESKVKRSLFYSCTDGSRVDGRGSLDTTLFEQCTFDENVVGVNSTPTDNSTTTADSCIFSNSLYSFILEGSTASIIRTYTDLWNNTNEPFGAVVDGGRNIEVDPYYLDVLDRDYNLTVQSQLIGSANPDIEAWTADGRHPTDIGAFQFDIQEAFMSYDWGTEKLVYHVKLAMGDRRGKAYTDQVCLALLNRAVDWYFSTYPDEAANCGLIETDYTVTLSSNVGSLSADILMVKGARQESTPSRDVTIYPVADFKRKKTSNMTKGTFYYPIAGVDLSARRIHLDSENYSGNILVDYIRKPLKLKIAGVEDEYGEEAGVTVDPEWPSQFNLPILQKANELGVQVYNRDTAQGDSDKQALEILRRMTA